MARQSLAVLPLLAPGAGGVVVGVGGLLLRALVFGDVAKVDTDAVPDLGGAAHAVDEDVVGGEEGAVEAVDEAARGQD